MPDPRNRASDERLPPVTRSSDFSLDLRIGGKFEREGKKFGIGSSGSVVLLTLKAMGSSL